LAGLIKAGLIFVKSAKKNITRIVKLKEPKIWLFYEPKFTFSLVLMISFAVVLSKIAEQIDGFHYGIAALDISLSTALFISGLSYLRAANYKLNTNTN